MANMLNPQESYNIIGAAIEVHKELGIGFLEKVYQDALELEFKSRGIPYEREKHITISYKGHTIDHDYYADFICYGNIIVELKAVSKLTEVHERQVLNYLKGTNNKLGLLINFGEPSLKHQRILNHYIK